MIPTRGKNGLGVDFEHTLAELETGHRTDHGNAVLDFSSDIMVIGQIGRAPTRNQTYEIRSDPGLDVL